MQDTQPTLNEIIKYDNILKKKEFKILKDLLHNTPDPDDNKLIIFNRPIGNDFEPELDEINVLDMNGKLTDGLINTLIEDHKGKHKDEEGWGDSISRFEKLKIVIKQYNNEVLELKLLPVTEEKIPPLFPKFTGEEYRSAKKHFDEQKKSLGGKSKNKKKSGKKSKRKKGKKSGKTRKI